MGEPILKRLVAALNRSRSIRSMHLDGNPKVNDPKIMSWITERLHAVD